MQQISLIDAIKKLQGEAHQASLKRNGLQFQLNEAIREEQRVTTDLRSLRELAVRWGVISEDEAVPEPKNEWPSYNRQVAVQGALEELDEPVHLSKILEFLRSVGRDDDTIDLISAALSSLRKKGTAMPLGNGVWRVATTDDAPHGLRLSPGGVDPDDLHYNVFANDAEVG